jgi:hypothetical protein
VKTIGEDGLFICSPIAIRVFIDEEFIVRTLAARLLVWITWDRGHPETPTIVIFPEP